MSNHHQLYFLLLGLLCLIVCNDRRNKSIAQLTLFLKPDPNYTRFVVVRRPCQGCDAGFSGFLLDLLNCSRQNTLYRRRAIRKGFVTTTWAQEQGVPTLAVKSIGNPADKFDIPIWFVGKLKYPTGTGKYKASCFRFMIRNSHLSSRAKKALSCLTIRRRIVPTEVSSIYLEQGNQALWDHQRHFSEVYST